MVYNDLMLFIQFFSNFAGFILSISCFWGFFSIVSTIYNTVPIRNVYSHCKKWELDLVSHFKSTMKKESTFWPWSCDEKTQHGRDFQDGCWGQ